MIIHFHNSSVANSGDVKRISNIDRAFATCYRDRTLEVVFYPFRKIGSLRKMDRFKVSEFTKQKLRIPLLPRSHVLNVYYRSLILGLLCLIYRPKVFIGEMAFPLHLVGAIKRMSPRTRVFADFHGAVVDEYLYQNPDIDEKRLARILETDRYTARAADYVLCQSDEMKRYLIDKYGVRPEKVQVYRCGYDASLFVLDRSSRTRTRQALGVAQDDVLFVYSGGLHKWQ